MRIDTIVTDLDDTLLNGSAELSPFTLQMIAELSRRGIRFLAASGRAASSMRPFVSLINAGQPYIASNGAQILSPDHTVLHEDLFTPEQARELIRYFQEKNIYMQCYRDDYFYFASENENSKRYARQTGMAGKAVNDLYAFVDFSTPKVLSVAAPDVVEALYPLIQKDFPDVSFTISKPYFLEAQPKGVSKGSALKWLGERLGFTPETTMAFGDSLNDLEMLRYTSYGVAMQNARDEVKRAVRYVTDYPNTQDGLAHFVMTHVLSETEGA